MEKLKIKLENCYGIKKLEKEFDFSSSKTFAIYAPNGVMKTSFANIFIDLSLGLKPKDRIFPDRQTICEVKKESNIDVAKEEIFVIESYNEELNLERISTLLVSKSLKDRYDEIYLSIDEKKDKLLKELKSLSGLRDDIGKEISKVFMDNDNKIFDALNVVRAEVMNASAPEFSDISYKKIFNDKALNFLETKDFKDKVEKYIKKYDELVELSDYFRKGIFNHYNASVVAKILVDNGFFKAEHFVSLRNQGGVIKEINTKEEFNQVIEDEKNKILNSPDLVRDFEEIDNKLKVNKELRDFQEYLANNVKILLELKDVNKFKQKIWISYLKSHQDLYIDLLNEYQSVKEELDSIVKKAVAEETRWSNVINDFNEIFLVPFRLIMKNQADIILKRDVPVIDFEFKESELSEEKALIDKDSLLRVLSSGERRALYILNIIFEIEVRRENNQETLFIIDDIVDSFDYKNKYAIIEYLKDISKDANFRQIILTHNFDFFRTIERRFIKYQYCFMVEKALKELKIVPASNIRNPFKNWIVHLDDDKNLIASVPFLRNLIEYTKDETNDDYLKLTALLHKKTDSSSILKSDLAGIYNRFFPSLSLSVIDGNKPILNLIFDLADNCLTTTESINLENKIILSIAIRLKAEEFMLSKMSDKSEVGGTQTIKFLERFKNEFANQVVEKLNIKILERVNLMTPENIHLNSFMYEPILDMSDRHLIDLYKKVKSLSLSK